MELSTFLKKLPANTYSNPAPHAVYKPAAPAPAGTGRPKNVILLIGDGMGLAQVYTGYTLNQGDLNLFQIRDIGFSITAAADNYITDSAAGATAMATGHKTRNRYISVDTVGKPLPAITQSLKQKDFRTAIISAGDITDATPACFYAHQPERSMSEAIALDFMGTNNDILIGGGVASFTRRKDDQNLLSRLAQKGYTVSTSFAALDTIRSNRFVVLDDSAVVSKQKGRGDFLPHALQKSLSALTPGGKPFFIMAEGAQIDWGGHSNNVEYVGREMLDFDQAIGEALRFADRNGETLVVITADHETGGLSLLGGNVAARTVRGNFSTGDHTGIPVPVFAYGPGAEQFRGVYQNTEICRKICALLGVTLP
jgi:alkaline phosphatase